MEILDSGFYFYLHFCFLFCYSFLFDSNIQIPLKKCYKECDSLDVRRVLSRDGLNGDEVEDEDDDDRGKRRVTLWFRV